MTLMGKVSVNGPDTCEVYRFLKHASSSGDLGWNFDRYFLVSKSGRVTSFAGLPFAFETTLDNMLSGLEAPDL